MDDPFAFLMLLGPSAGAGALTSLLFTQMRKAIPCPTKLKWSMASPLARIGYTLLWAPLYARYTVFVLAILISLALTGVTAVMTGVDVMPALAAASSALVTQLIHATGLASYVQVAKKDERPDASN